MIYTKAEVLDILERHQEHARRGVVIGLCLAGLSGGIVGVLVGFFVGRM